MLCSFLLSPPPSSFLFAEEKELTNGTVFGGRKLPVVLKTEVFIYFATRRMRAKLVIKKIRKKKREKKGYSNVCIVIPIVASVSLDFALT